jgi:hypothetical protein
LVVSVKELSVSATGGGSRFSDWAERWMELANYRGIEIRDVDDRIEGVVALWHEPIPGDWKRVEDERLIDPTSRYCRGNADPRRKRRGEHAIEYDILEPSPAEWATICLGGRLVDGVNAIPLARDAGGGRAGNVEADMLLLVHERSEWRLLLVEVKAESNNAWYAVVENLRQMALLLRSDASRSLFHHRQPDLGLPASVPATAIVLAPREFYTSDGAKKVAVGPARRLIGRMREEAQVSVELATWDSARRVIAPLIAI